MKLAWYPFYPSDYLGDTLDLSAEEHGVYHLLLHRYWLQGPLPDDLDRLCRIAAGAQPQSVRTILERYWILGPEGWANLRMQTLRVQQIDSHERRVKAGRLGGQAKASNAVAMLKQCSSNQNQNQKKKEENPLQDLPVGLKPEVWQAFREVRKKAKATMTPHAETLVLNKIRKLCEDGTDPNSLVEQSIERGWKTVFPLKTDEQRNGNNPVNANALKAL